MAKLLIVEDHLRMVRMIQTYLHEINPRFTPENTFCFSHQDPLELRPLSEFPEDNARVSLAEKQEALFSEVFHFLDKCPDENVLILIDVLLNTQNISAPSFDRYRADHEYSCELYAELLRVKNGKRILGCNNINRRHFFHIIYSRSDSSIGVVAAVLEDLWVHQSEENQKYFPKECTQFENISWCRNRYDATAPDFSIAEVQKQGKVLALPREYREFIHTLQ